MIKVHRVVLPCLQSCDCIPKFSIMKSDRALWSRRRFLRQSSGAVAGLGLARVAAAGAPEKIVDSHVHFYDTTRPGGVPWPSRDNAVLYSPHLPASFRALTQNLGVTGVVVIEAEALPADNDWVLNLAKTEPLILAYIARLTPGQPEFAANFERYTKSPIFRGLRLREDDLAQGLGQRKFDRDLQQIAERQLTIDVVGGAGMLANVQKIAEKAPGSPIVIDHLPFAEWDFKPAEMRAALRPVAEHPNVCAKISYVLRRVNGRLLTDLSDYQRTLDTLWSVFGNDRVIYGSNWPVSDVTGPYDAVLKVVRDYVSTRAPASAEKYFWKNSQKAYGWRFRQS